MYRMTTKTANNRTDDVDGQANQPCASYSHAENAIDRGFSNTSILEASRRRRFLPPLFPKHGRIPFLPSINVISIND